VVHELTKVQRGETERMSERHPRELEPLTDSINAFIREASARTSSASATPWPTSRTA
jgi:hypothetical protein